MGNERLIFGHRDLVETEDGDYGEIVARHRKQPSLRRYQYSVLLNTKVSNFPPITYKASELTLVCPARERTDLTEHDKGLLNW